MEKFSKSFLNEIKRHSTTIASRVLRHSPDGNFICPICGNGSGSSGTGITFKDNGNAYCHNDGWIDIFKAVEAAEHCTFPEAVKICADHLGKNIEYDDDGVKVYTSKNSKIRDNNTIINAPDFTPDTNYDYTKDPSNPLHAAKDLTDYYIKCNQELPKYKIAVDYLKSRNLYDEKLIADYKIGYDPEINCIIIPHTKYYCTRRMITNDKKLRFCKNLTGVSPMLFNADCMKTAEFVFVVEGAMNAMSIIKTGFQAVAIGATSNVKLFINEIKALDKEPAFIILTDSDDAGEKAAVKIKESLRKLNIFHTQTHLPNKQDANDMLRSDETELKNFLEKTITETKEKLENWKSKITEKSAQIDNQQYEYKPPENISLPEHDPYIKLPVPISNGLKLICPEGYSITMDGVWKQGKKEWIRVTHKPTLIIKKIENIDKNIHQQEIAVYDAVKQKWNCFIANDSDISNTRKITKFADLGLDVLSTKAALMVNYLNNFYYENLNNIPTVDSVSQLGWRGNDFIYPNSDNNDYMIDIDDDGESIEIFGMKGDKKKYLSYYEKATNASNYARFAIGASLAAPLVEICNCRSMITHLGGTSGGGKSATLNIACSIYENPTYGVSSFNTTFVALERRLVAMKNFPVFVDELQLAKNDKSWQYHLPKLPFFISDSASKGRATIQGKERTKYFRTIVLTSGEDFMTEYSSEMGAKQRVVELNAKEYLPKKLAKEINAEICKENYGLVGREWIEFIKKNKEIIKSNFNNLRDALSEKFPNSSVDHINLVALSTVASSHFDIEFLHKDKFDTESKNFDCACQILEELPKVNEMSDTERAKKVIEEAAEIHARNFTDKHGTFPSSDNNDFWGIKEDDFTAFVPTILRNILTSNGFSARKIIKELINEGYIIKDNQGNSTKNINNKRLYYIPINNLMTEAA